MYIPDLIRKHALRRGLSPRTIKTYNQCINQFFRFCKKDPKYVSKKDINEFLDELIKKEASGNTINVYLCSLKFFYNNILNKRLMTRIRFSKTPKTLPVFLTKDEIRKLFDAINNPKHKLMVKLMYSAGLRVSELVKLKKEDFDFENNYGWVRKGKGNKDRLFIIANSLKEELIESIKDKQYYIFMGQNNNHISTRTIYEIIKKAGKKAGIKKKAHPHTLRHSFATHLIENGYSISDVQFLLGHSKTDTSMIYVHMASPRMINVESPLDNTIQNL